MTTKELITRFKVPSDRIESFKVILSQMKHKDLTLTAGVDYTMNGGTVNYLDSAIPKIKDRIKNFKKPKTVYILDGEHRRVK